MARIRLGSEARALCAAAAALTACLWAGGLAGAQEAATPPERTAWSIPSERQIRDLLADRMQANGVGVVVGIVDAEGHHVVSYGRSGAADGRPLDGDTIFQIGSVTKVFTTLLLADMALRGEAGLDDPASGYLPPGVRMPRNGREITLADLATHVSGLPSMPTNYDLAAEPDPYEAYSVADLHELLSSYMPERAPGESFEYSNLGVALLGRLLADRAGKDYEQLLKERILDPLGMTSTAIRLAPEQEARLAPGHDRYLKPVRTWEMTTLPGSGSLRSSVNDLLRMLDAYLGYEDCPLDAAMQHQLAAVRHPVPGATQLLGWSERTFQGVTIVGHDGGKQGYRSAVVFDPVARVGVVILANARTDDTPIALAVHILTGRPLPPAPPAPQQTEAAMTTEELDAYAGRYSLGEAGELVVARKGDHLLVDHIGRGVTELFAAGPGELRSNIGDEALTLRTGPDGRVAGLELRQGSRTTEAVRIE